MFPRPKPPRTHHIVPVEMVADFRRAGWSYRRIVDVVRKTTGDNFTPGGLARALYVAKKAERMAGPVALPDPA